MASRNITFVMIDKEYKVAQYCRLGAKPSEQGACLLYLLRDVDLNILCHKIRKCSSLSSEERYEIFNMSCNFPEKLKKKHPEFSDEIGGGVLRVIYDSITPLSLDLQVEFAAESLYCEWAYVVDFDKMTFEVCRGCNQEPLYPSDRFFFLQDEDKEKDYYSNHGSHHFFPVKLVKSFPLCELPLVEEFLVEMGELESE